MLLLPFSVFCVEVPSALSGTDFSWEGGLKKNHFKIINKKAKAIKSGCIPLSAPQKDPFLFGTFSSAEVNVQINSMQSFHTPTLSKMLLFP